MGSSSSSQANHTSPTPWAKRHERLAPFIAWCGNHPYVSLGVTTAVCALLTLGIWGASDPSVIEDGDEDEIAALGALGDIEAESGGEVRVKPRRARESWPEPLAGIDAPVPLFDGNSEFDHGIVAATFEGASRTANVGPVWLAGTIETDDVLPQADFLPTIPPPVRQAAGPLLIPQ